MHWFRTSRQRYVPNVKALHGPCNFRQGFLHTAFLKYTFWLHDQLRQPTWIVWRSLVGDHLSFLSVQLGYNHLAVFNIIMKCLRTTGNSTTGYGKSPNTTAHQRHYVVKRTIHSLRVRTIIWTTFLIAFFPETSRSLYGKVGQFKQK